MQIEDLISLAQNGEKLNSKDRQRCVAHLLSAGQPKITNVKMAKMFQVTEGQIRADKRRNAPKPTVRVTFTPSSGAVPEGFELVRVTEYEVIVPLDKQERARLLRDNGTKKQQTRKSSLLRMSLRAIADDLIKKGEL